MQLSAELLMELEGLRSATLLPKEGFEVAFYRDGTFRTQALEGTTPVEPASLEEVQRIIQEFKSIDLAVLDIDEIEERLAPLTPGYRLASPIIQRDATVYRGVRWSDRPQRTADLSYPPETCIKTFHRAGRPGRPLFYCSTARESPLFELGVIPGDAVAISHWRTTARLVVNNVGYHDEVFGNLRSIRDCPWWGSGKEVDDLEGTSPHIRRFFATEFAKIVSSGQEYLYKTSIAIAELHFSHQMFAGLLYPSLAFRADADNLALKPECVDQYLKVHRVEYIRVDEKRDDGFKVTILDFADSFGPDGGIHWKGRHPQWMMRRPGEVLHFTIENERWVARDEQGRIVQPE